MRGRSSSSAFFRTDRNAVSVYSTPSSPSRISFGDTVSSFWPGKVPLGVTCSSTATSLPVNSSPSSSRLTKLPPSVSGSPNASQTPIYLVLLSFILMNCNKYSREVCSCQIGGLKPPVEHEPVVSESFFNDSAFAQLHVLVDA